MDLFDFKAWHTKWKLDMLMLKNQYEEIKYQEFKKGLGL